MNLCLIHIQWIDSCSEIGWEEYSEPAEQITHTMGILINETNNYVIIAHSFDPSTNEWNGRICIPNCAIKDLKVICQIQI